MLDFNWFFSAETDSQSISAFFCFFPTKIVDILQLEKKVVLLRKILVVVMEAIIGDTFISTTGGKDIGAIIVYPLATPTIEQVAGQTLALTSDTNIIDITQASLQGLELEVKAK